MPTFLAAGAESFTFGFVCRFQDWLTDFAVISSLTSKKDLAQIFAVLC